MPLSASRLGSGIVQACRSCCRTMQHAGIREGEKPLIQNDECRTKSKIENSKTGHQEHFCCIEEDCRQVCCTEGRSGLLLAPSPPPLRRHQINQENEGQTWPRCLDKAVLARDVRYQRMYVTENLPIPYPKHNCRNRALGHNVQHFSASSGGPHCPSGASRAVE